MSTRAEETVRFPSTDGTTEVAGTIWRPQGEPRAVVQLVHGMAEYIGRYAAFARYLTDEGYLVCGHDHVGHGRSVSTPADLGHLPVTGGRDVLVGDVGRMRDCVRKDLPKTLPHFLFGHSMGSFVVRAYVSESAYGLSGAVICGTGQIPTGMSVGGNLLARAIAATRGERYVSKLLVSLSVGGYNSAIENPRTEVDWLSYNTQNCDAYIADELCGFPFTAGGNATLTALTREVCSPTCARKVPSELPLLYIGGDADPVGNAGEDVRLAAALARDAGSRDVTCKIFSHMRHELLNEEDSERVMRYVTDWMEERL